MVRQLTAIMFTDMVGYTALMQQDERRAKASRDRQRSVLEDRIAGHSGRILQHYGDGTLSVFRSAIDAVRCAVEIQERLRMPPPVPLRIGIHTGDVVHDEEGVFGDGVNVASRIQGLAVAGGILITGKVFDEVKNHGDIRTRSLGAFNLKHVQHPMKVFAVVNDGLSVPSGDDLTAERASTPNSVAVLPFVNMSSERDNEYFSDGITEEIINALTQVNGLKVTARTSSFAFKNRNEDIRQIAERLAVTHVLEGSVRRAGNRVRVTAQLICAPTGFHMFSENYDSSLEDVFAVQDQIARKIVERLAEHLRPVKTSDTERRISVSHSHDTKAHAEYLKGRFEFARFSPEGSRKAIAHYERALELDPDCALPYAGLAGAYVFLGSIGHAPAAEAYARAEAAATRAVELEPEAGASHVALAMVRLFHNWDFQGAYHSLQKALTLTPGSADAHHLYAMYLEAIGDFDDAVDEARTAVELSPLSAVCNEALAHALALAGRAAEAREAIDRTMELDPLFRSAVQTSGWCYVAAGDLEAAAAEMERLPAMAGREYASASDRAYVYGRLGRTADVERMLALLDARRAAQPDVTLDLDYALVYEGLGDRDRALDHISRAIDRRMGSVVLLETFVSFRAARQDPRFRALLRRIGLPQAVAV
jgi:TolB-like protein/class 3 adenylate cyclase/Flp pilus assembly protein TadD